MKYAWLVLVGCGYPQPAQVARDAQAIDAAIDARAIDAVDATAIDASDVVTIQQVQNPAMAPGTQVHLEGVIITAIDAYGAKTGDCWVEEPGGGEYSGIHVFGADVTGLVVGDVVSVREMQKTLFALSSDTSGRTETELEPVTGMSASVVKTASATVPAPEQVDALAIQQLTEPAQSQEWAKWDGVLVTLAQVREKTAPAQVGSDPTLQQFSITGNAQAESLLAAFPAGLTTNVCLASVTGVVGYFLIYQIYPRSTSETVTGGAGCPP